MRLAFGFVAGPRAIGAVLGRRIASWFAGALGLASTAATVLVLRVA